MIFFINQKTGSTTRLPQRKGDKIMTKANEKTEKKANVRRQKVKISVELGKAGYEDSNRVFHEWPNNNKATGEQFRLGHARISVVGFVSDDPTKNLVYRQVGLMLGRTDRGRVYLQSDAQGRNKEEFLLLPKGLIAAMCTKCVKEWNLKNYTEFIADQGVQGTRDYEEYEIEIEEEVAVPA